MAMLFLYLLSLVCWLGAIIFFSAVVAPSVFQSIPIAEAGKLLSVLFPRYYLVGYIAGSIAVLLSFYFALTRAARGWWALATVALAIALGLTLYAGVIVRPRVDAIRTVVEEPTPDPARRAEFDRLHRTSVMLNGAVLLFDLLALAASAAALSP